MIKDIFEDHSRRKQDNTENNQSIEAVPRGTHALRNMRSYELQVGCFVKVKQNENFPADLILLQSTLPQGICYVETKNLDGETNLKQKQASQSLHDDL